MNLTEHPLTLFLVFNAGVVLLLLADLLLFQRKSHEVKMSEALKMVAVWVALGLAFNVFVYFYKGETAAMQYFTGYVVEYALSMDNVFVFIMIFTYFSVPAKYQHRVLFWGILGAMLMRGGFIFAGTELIKRFDFLMYVLGAFLILTGIKLLKTGSEEIHPERNAALKLFRKIFPVTKDYEGGKFLVRREHKTWATPLLVVLVLLETTDIVFAVDSIPAIFGITDDPFIIYSSNLFAILGLRALYFVLAGFMKRFRYLNIGLCVVLIFIGCKMIVRKWYHAPDWLMLTVVAGIIIVSVLASVFATGDESDKKV
ncbi:MAG: TerC family protein [Candidatus Brocadiia bacterium]